MISNVFSLFILLKLSQENQLFFISKTFSLSWKK